MLNSPLHLASLGPHTSLGQIFEGTSSDDSQDGTTDSDLFIYDQGGNDTLNGLGGDDRFRMGGAFNADDKIDGGDGNDTLVLDGDYATTSVSMNATTLVNVETIQLTAGNSYSLSTYSNLNVATLTVDATALGAADFARLSVSSVNSGAVNFEGGAGNDQLSAGRSTILFDGNGGDDTINFQPGGYTTADTVDGGAGDDTMIMPLLNTASLAFASSSIRNLEHLNAILMSSQPFAFFGMEMQDANVAAKATLTLTFIPGGPSPDVYFDGTRESDGHFVVSAAPGNGTFLGGAQSDTFYIAVPGTDDVSGGGGNDLVSAGSGLDNGDRLDGGLGTDTLALHGDYSAGLTFAPDLIHNIERLNLDSGFSYYLTLDPANIDAKKTLRVDGSSLTASDFMDVRAEHTQGHLNATGGAAGDTLVGGDVTDHLTGGDGDDTLVGGLGGDTLEGDAGHDTFHIYSPDNSTGRKFDTLIVFNADEDRIVTRGSVTAIDAGVNGGALSRASFNADLGAAIGSGELGALHAVLFRPDHGGLKDHTFLIVDDNGIAGYQANADFVFDVTGALHLGHLGTANFGPLLG